MQSSVELACNTFMAEEYICITASLVNILSTSLEIEESASPSVFSFLYMLALYKLVRLCMKHASSFESKVALTRPFVTKVNQWPFTLSFALLFTKVFNDFNSASELFFLLYLIVHFLLTDPLNLVTSYVLPLQQPCCIKAHPYTVQDSYGSVRQYCFFISFTSELENSSAVHFFLMTNFSGGDERGILMS